MRCKLHLLEAFIFLVKNDYLRNKCRHFYERFITFYMRIEDEAGRKINVSISRVHASELCR